MVPEIGATYRLRNDPGMGDYAGSEVVVETGPRSAGTPDEQYRVSWGPGSHDVDWINTTMFEDSIKISG